MDIGDGQDLHPRARPHRVDRQTEPTIDRDHEVGAASAFNLIHRFHPISLVRYLIDLAGIRLHTPCLTTAALVWEEKSSACPVSDLAQMLQPPGPRLNHNSWTGYV